MSNNHIIKHSEKHVLLYTIWRLFALLENIHKEDQNLNFPWNKTNKRHANRTKLQRQHGRRIVISLIMNCKTLCLPVQIEILEQ